MNIKKDISWRVYVTYIGLVIFALCIIARIAYTQQVQGKYWKSLADSLTTDFKTIEADRGNIYSEDGRLLATSLPFFEIRMDTRAEAVSDELFNEKVDSLAIKLSHLLKDKLAEEYRRIMVSGRKNDERYVLLNRKVTFTELQLIRKFPIFNLGKYKGGLIAIQEFHRVNPFNQLCLRTIGLYRDSNKVGLEKTYDEYLSGVNGKQLMQRIAGNTWLPLTDENAIEPQNGKDVYTTIDVGLQDVAESALLNTLVKNEAEHGCVILMEVKTGKIKALANLGRDENGGPYSERMNYAISEAIEPGSTFKMASCAALLESGLADTSTMIDLEHGHKVYGKQIMKDHELAVNYVSLKTAFAISSNVGISKFAYNAFNDKQEMYTNYLKQFGITQKTGIDLSGEANPDVKEATSKRWNKVVSLPWMSVGYEERITPLQTLCWYNSIANDGKRMKPFLVSKVTEYGKVVKQFNPTVANEKVVSEKTVKKLRGIMEAVVLKGTAKGVLLNSNYSAAGKTGTAQIFQAGSGFNNKGVGSKKFLASFVGYFPADNPQYSCIVVIYNPTKDKSVYYGSQVACPVFKELADKVYATSTFMHAPIEKNDSLLHPEDRPGFMAGATKEIEKVLTELKSSHSIMTEGNWCSVIKEGKNYSSAERQIQQGVVPDVTGFSLKDALYVLENKGLKVKFKGNGKVIEQYPNAGEVLVKGSEINLELSN